MKCQAFINQETKIALDGAALMAASKNPDSPRCGYELGDDDVFCPSCGATKEISQPQFMWDGRATRKEYWKVVLKLVGSIVLVGIITVGLVIADVNGKVVFTLTFLSSAILGLCSIPVSVRRLHDLGFSGLLLLPAICIGITSEVCRSSGDSGAGQVLNVIGMIVNLLLGIPMGFMRGTKGPNKYGVDPLETN